MPSSELRSVPTMHCFRGSVAATAALVFACDLLHFRPVSSCTTIIVGKNASADGSTMTTHNADVSQNTLYRDRETEPSTTSTLVPTLTFRPGRSVIMYFYSYCCTSLRLSSNDQGIDYLRPEQPIWCIISILSWFPSLQNMDTDLWRPHQENLCTAAAIKRVESLNRHVSSWNIASGSSL